MIATRRADGFEYSFTWSDLKGIKGIYCAKLDSLGERKGSYWLFPKLKNKWSCSCPSGQYRKYCKHLTMIKDIFQKGELSE